MDKTNNQQKLSLEYQIIRYSIQSQSHNLKTKLEGLKNFLSTAVGLQCLAWEIIQKIQSDPVLSLNLPELLQLKDSISGKVVQTNQLDSYFLKLNPKDIENETLKIKDYARKYYDLGCFYQFNSVFVRYVTSIKSDLSESELQVFLIKYVISSILTSGYDVAISEISKLKLQFHSYDISIYAFFLKIIQKKYYLAEEEILNISSNVFPEVFEKLLTAENLNFYFILILVICYKKHFLQGIQTNQSYIHRLYEDSRHLFAIVENYSKCRFVAICSEFEDMKKGILSDPLICEDFLRINRELKLNIIKEIVKCSSAVSIDFLATTVKESPEVLEDWILFGISDGSIRVRIDDIEKVLYSVESDCVSTTISKTLEYMKRSYDNSVIKLISLSSSSMYNDSQMILEKMKTYEIELDSMRGMLRQGGLRDEEDPMENIESY